jgi:iron-sulfur cluster assembly protein
MRAKRHDNVGTVPAANIATISAPECRPVIMQITITPAAHARMQHFLATAPTAAGVRFGVKRTGCSGFGYVVDLAQTVVAGESILDVDGVPLVVSDANMALVDGTVIDFQRQGLNSSFVFHNPNATGECGCGESFTVA